MRLIGIGVLVAAAALTACEKAEDRALLGSGPKLDLRYCAEGAVTATFQMPTGWCMASINRAYVLDLAADGVLRVRAVRDGRPAETVWASAGKAKTLNTSIMVFQGDGNLVVYEGMKPVWNSQTYNHASANQLALTDQGELRLQGPGGLVWSSKTGRAPGA